MKYIVLYIATILLFTAPELMAQKPAIDLLPSDHGIMHPEAMIDTSYTKDTLVFFGVPAAASDSTIGMVPPKSRDRKGSQKLEKGHWEGILESLIIHRLYPLRMFILITALNI